LALFYQQDINDTTKLAIWKIEEPESFFLSEVPLQGNITHSHKRLQHLAGRYLLKILFPGFPHHEIEIANTRKPFLRNEQYHFSISHCSDYAAAIVSTQCRVGIDVEVITPRIKNIKHKFLHPEEMRFVNSRPPDEQETYLTVMWSAKEAMFKWYGLGEVDFSEMLRLMPFALTDPSVIHAAVITNQVNATMQLPFRLFDNVTMVYGCTLP
jgi:phosphopantetheinyl transferase